MMVVLVVMKKDFGPMRKHEINAINGDLHSHTNAIFEEAEMIKVEIAADPKNASKPEAIIEKMVVGRLAKFKKEICLVDQAFVKDPNKKVSQLLTEKECKVIQLYYYEELTLKEIANILEVSESRISQLHTRALQKMRTKMGNYMGILTDR